APPVARTVDVVDSGIAGHGVGSTRDQLYAERADVYAFFLAASEQRATPPPMAAANAANAAEQAQAISGAHGCETDNACSAVSDYCRGCSCRALAVGEPEPECKEAKVACFASPCLGQRAVCRAHKCVLEKSARGAAR
ncbi:MAG TPA: hypothetical protein VHZ95_06675, partial [Polyangiales bacterium]|nr:hypothetical protein [Polyangiales bacterium]